MSNSPRGQVQTPSKQDYVGDPNSPTTHMTWTEGVTITPVKRTDSSVKEHRQQALNTAKERAKNDLRKILAKHGHDFKSARKNEKLWKKVRAAYQKRKKEYFQEIVSNRQNNRNQVRNQISQVNPSWDSMKGINLEHIHTTLDIAGLIPGFGIVPDALNAGLYVIEGDWANAGVSVLSMLPGLGQISSSARLAKRGGKTVITIGDRAGDRLSQEIAKRNKILEDAYNKSQKMRKAEIPEPKKLSKPVRHHRKHHEGMYKKGEGYDEVDIATDVIRKRVDLPEIKTPEELEKRALDFFKGKPPEHVEQFIRESDGAVLRYDSNSGIYGVMKKDGTINTFFRPDEGLEYVAKDALGIKN